MTRCGDAHHYHSLPCVRDSPMVWLYTHRSRHRRVDFRMCRTFFRVSTQRTARHTVSYLTTSVAAGKAKSSRSLATIRRLCFPVEKSRYTSRCKGVIHTWMPTIQKDTPEFGDQLLGVRPIQREVASKPNHPSKCAACQP